MDFARDHLLSLGWRDGEGLGRQRQGCPRPVRVPLKRDTAGVGCNAAAAEFSDPWWTSVYDDAARRVPCDPHESRRVSSEKTPDADRPATATARHGVYGRFVSAGYLAEKNDSSGGEKSATSHCHSISAASTTTDRVASSSSSSSSSDEDEDTMMSRVCGGARMSAKLARLQRQQDEWLTTRGHAHAEK